HSWGAALGLLYAQAHPDKVSAFIGVNPVVSTREGQQAEYDFVLAEASRRKDNGVLAHLRKIGPPPYKRVGQVLAMEKLSPALWRRFSQGTKADLDYGSSHLWRPRHAVGNPAPHSRQQRIA